MAIELSELANTICRTSGKCGETIRNTRVLSKDAMKMFGMEFAK